MAESSETCGESLGELTAFEKYLLWDDHDDAPMTPVVQVDFDEALNADDLGWAFAVALERHPLLRSRVLESRGALRWETTEHVSAIEIGKPPMWRRPIDLSSQPGLRGWLVQRPAGNSLFLQWHHACCDGVGMRAFLIDMLQAYAAIRTGKAAEKRPEYSPEQLSKRGDISEFRPRQAISRIQKLRNAYYFHFQPPTALACRVEEQKNKTGQLGSSEAIGGLPTCEIDREQSSRLRDKCRKSRVSPNSVALAILFQQCLAWNERLGESKTSKRFRILVPFDLRTSDCSKLSAANRMSFAFVGRTRGQVASGEGDVKGFAAGIHDEMQYNRDTMLPLDFLRGLEVAARSPRALKALLAASNRMATAVLTYTGDVGRGIARKFPHQSDGSLQIGDCRLLRVIAAPPVRRNTHIAIGVCQNWGKFCLSATVSEEFGLDAGKEFLEEYQSRWLNYAAERVNRAV